MAAAWDFMFRLYTGSSHTVEAPIAVTGAHLASSVVLREGTVATVTAGVDYDATADGAANSGSTSITPFNITLGAGADGGVAVGLTFDNVAVSGISVTIGGVAASLIAGTDTNADAYGFKDNRCLIYGRATGSTTGSVAIAVSWTGSSGAVAGALSFKNIDQSTPFNNGTELYFNNGSGSPVPASLTVTSTSGDRTFSFIGTEAADTQTAPTQTERFNRVNGSFSVRSQGSTGPGTGTTTHTYTIAAFKECWHSGANAVLAGTAPPDQGVTGAFVTGTSVVYSPQAVTPGPVTVTGATITSASNARTGHVVTTLTFVTGTTIATGSNVRTGHVVTPGPVTVVGTTRTTTAVVQSAHVVTPGAVTVTGAHRASTIVIQSVHVVTPGAVTISGVHRASTAVVNVPHVVTPPDQAVTGANISGPPSTIPSTYWPLDEGSGTTSADEGTSAAYLLTLDTAGSWTTGKFGTALHCDGTGIAATIAPEFDSALTYSFSLWMSGWDGSDDGILIGGKAGDYVFYLDSTDIYHSGENNYVSAAHGGGLTVGWHHLVVTRASTIVTFYKDGVPLTSSGPMSADIALVINSIGSYETGTFPFTGTLDDIRYYDNVCLTPTQVADLYAVGIFAPTVAHVAIGAQTIVGAFIGGALVSDDLLLEDGSFALLEDGTGHLLLEAAATGAAQVFAPSVGADQQPRPERLPAVYRLALSLRWPRQGRRSMAAPAPPSTRPAQPCWSSAPRATAARRRSSPTPRAIRGCRCRLPPTAATTGSNSSTA